MMTLLFLEVNNITKMSAPMRKLIVTSKYLNYTFLKGMTWSRLAVVLQRKRCNHSSTDSPVQANGKENSTGFDDYENQENPQAVFGDYVNQEKPQQFQYDALTEREIPKSKDELYKRLLMPPDQPENAKILKLAIIGAPNSGKSTLMNQIMRWKISAVSKKVHTTRRNTKAVLTRDDTQIVFMDTPGIRDPRERKKYFLEKSLILDPERSLENADLVAVIVDAADKWTRNQLSVDVLKLLYLHPERPSILILNKVDAVKTKEGLLQVTRMLTEDTVGGEKIVIHTKKLKKQTKKEETNLNDLFDRYEQHLQGKKEKQNLVSISNHSNSEQYLQDEKEKQNSTPDRNHSNNEQFLKDEREKQNSVSLSKHSNSNVSVKCLEKIEGHKKTEDGDYLKTVDSDSVGDGNLKDFEILSDSDPKEYSDTELMDENSRNIQKTDEPNVDGIDPIQLFDAKITKAKETLDLEYPKYVEKLKTVKKLVQNKHGWPNFREVFMISALNGDGIKKLEDYIFSQARPGDWEYHSSFVTEQSPYEIARMCVWEKMLEYLPKEIPYMLYPDIIYWEIDEDDILCIVMDIQTYNNRECSHLIGPNGQMIVRISEEAKQELLNSFRCEIRLKLQVKLKPGKTKRR